MDVLNFESLPADILSMITTFIDHGRDVLNLWMSASRTLIDKLELHGGVTKLNLIATIPDEDRVAQSMINACFRWIRKFKKLLDLSMHFVTHSDMPHHIHLTAPLPELLKDFMLSGYCQLTPLSMRMLPSTLTSLFLKNRQEFTDAHILNLPRGLTHLALPDEEDYSHSGNSFQRAIAYKRASNLIFKDSYIPHLPQELLYLDLGCTKTIADEYIRQLPKSLIHLDLKRNENMTDTSIAHLPRNLTYLNLCNNRTLTSACAPLLPRTLLRLDLYRNENFTDAYIPHLPKKLWLFTYYKHYTPYE